MDAFRVNGLSLNGIQVQNGPRWIIFLHAFATNLTLWKKQLESIPSGWSALAYDMRGCGRSDVPTEVEKYSESTHVEDLLAVLEQNNIRTAVLCGLSMGGSIALSAALSHSTRFSGLILASVGAGVDDRVGTRILTEGWAQLLESKGVEAFADQLLLGPIYGSYARHGEAERSVLRDMITSNSACGLINTLRGVTQRRRSLDEVGGMLAALKLPTLVIVGDQDAPCLEPSQRLASQIPNSSIKVIEGAGHFCNLEKPIIFNSTLQHYLMSR